MQESQVISASDKTIVSVIIPTYKDWQRLTACLSALSEQTYSGKKFEVIVINNDPESSVELKPNIKKFTLLCEKKPGSYAARNLGVMHAKGDIIAFLDSDCLPEPEWIENGVRHIQNGEDRVAGRVRLFYKANSLSFAEIYEKAFAFDQYKNARKGCSVTANLLVSKAHIAKVGLFNEQLLSGGDFEWSKRASATGLTIFYAEDVVVRHPARATVAELKKKVKRTARNGYDPYSFSSLPALEKVIVTIKSVMPPIKSYEELYFRQDMSLREKIIAGVMAYYIKLYTTGQRLLTKLGAVQMVRS